MERLTEQAFQAITQKDLQSTLPLYWYWNPTFPFGVVQLWPVPTQAGLQGVMYAGTAVTQFSALTDALSLPPGYKRMIVKNLATEIAPQFAVTVTPELQSQAQQSMMVVKRANLRIRDIVSDPGSLTAPWAAGWGYDIRLGP